MMNTFVSTGIAGSMSTGIAGMSGSSIAMGCGFRIPRLGDSFVLPCDHVVPIHAEERNTTAVEAMGKHIVFHLTSAPGRYYIVGPEVAAEYAALNGGRWPYNIPGFQDRLEQPGMSWQVHPLTLPKGTKLTIERIYMRRGKRDLDSVTFRGKLPGRRKTIRFWLKLDDANGIPCHSPVAWVDMSTTTLTTSLI